MKIITKINIGWRHLVEHWIPPMLFMEISSILILLQEPGSLVLTQLLNIVHRDDIVTFHRHKYTKYKLFVEYDHDTNTSS